MKIPGGDGAAGSALARRAREDLLARVSFELDAFQVAACDVLDAGDSVLVSAPTGSGKTLVADYAVARALAAGRKAFYTTPLKALSNQKHAELAAAYGPERVGLLTGDISLRADAPVVVMTTEVLRNMIFAKARQLDGLGVVVLDEVHFLQDPYRGSVWEEVIILLAPEVALVCCSATVANAAQLGAWISQVHGPTRVISESSRPVRLFHHLALAHRGSGAAGFVPLLRGDRLHPRAAQIEDRLDRAARRAGGTRSTRIVRARRSELIEELAGRAMLPAIVFIFSRAACEDAVAQCLADGLRMTTAETRAEIRRRCEARTEGLPDDELAVLGYGPWSAGLEAGFAAHHAGMIPTFREAVEDCFSAGLLHVVFATETLALGINMPARTVVVERLTKVRAAGRSALTSGELAQMTGRAGRRGLDVEGHTVVPWVPNLRIGDLARLITSPAPDLRSSFRPTYNLAVNLVRRYPASEAHTLVDRSFAQFLDERHHHSLSRRLDRTLALLERFGYVDTTRWAPTDRGLLLARIYHESDLLVAEVLAEGICVGLDSPTLAAVVSACTFEARSGRGRPESRPPPPARAALGRIAAVAERIRAEEERSHLPRTRLPDAGLAAAVWGWARGQRLEHVLERAQVAPGDFVRNIKQLLDLLRQLQIVAPPATAETARAAAAALERGVVAASTFGIGREADAGPDARGAVGGAWSVAEPSAAVRGAPMGPHPP